jgi:hypothetical protein
MNRQGLARVIDSASFVTGLPLFAEGRFDDKSQPIEVRVRGLNEINTFHLKAHRSPMAWFIDLQFDTFSRPLVNKIVAAVHHFHAEFNEELERISKNGIQVDCQFSDRQIEKSSEDLGEKFFNLRLVSEPSTMQDTLSIDEEVAILSSLIQEALVLVTYILSDFDTNPLQIDAHPTEGVVNSTSCTKYSRSARNKKVCLDFYGYICAGCGLDPSRVYGETGRYIIHVHHLVPLSQMPAPGPVNPLTELVPLCPNCHNFVHKSSPPLNLDELKSALGKELLG